MKQLMAAEPFSKISVGDICQVCQMNRKSFYYHFRDKYDLVNWIFQTEFLTAVQRRPYESTWALIGDLCEYFYENRAFYHNALSVEGQNSFQDLDVVNQFLNDFPVKLLHIQIAADDACPLPDIFNFLPGFPFL